MIRGWLFQHYMLYIFQETNRERETESGRGGSGLDQRKEELGTCPHQPNNRFIETQSLKKKTQISGQLV